MNLLAIVESWQYILTTGQPELDPPATDLIAAGHERMTRTQTRLKTLIQAQQQCARAGLDSEAQACQWSDVATMTAALSMSKCRMIGIELEMDSEDPETALAVRPSDMVLALTLICHRILATAPASAYGDRVICDARVTSAASMDLIFKGTALRIEDIKGLLDEGDPELTLAHALVAKNAGQIHLTPQTLCLVLPRLPGR